MAKVKNPLSLNVQHDYITLRTPNGNFTTSWGGAKASGNLAKDGASFRKLDDYVQNFTKNGGSVGQAMENLTDAKLLTTLWPNWNAPVPVNDFKVGDSFKFKAGCSFIKKYGNQPMEVVKVTKKTVYFRSVKDNCIMGFDYQELEHA